LKSVPTLGDNGKTPREDRMTQSLEHFVTDTQAPVYCIRNLPEEVASVLFAYVSRSPSSFRQNLESLLGEEGIEAGVATAAFDPASEKARAFHEKWVVGYGHSSVAEHSVLRYGLEGVSILATKLLEDNRLASYTEKSTRYQYFGRDTWLRDPALAASSFGAECEARLNALMDLYRDTFDKLDAHLRRRHPPKPGAKPGPYEAALKAQVCDAARYLLPLATRTMLAVTVNARAAAWMITKLLSHPLAEARFLGLAMREQGRRVCPTLLRHADESPFLQATRGWSTWPCPGSPLAHCLPPAPPSPTARRPRATGCASWTTSRTRWTACWRGCCTSAAAATWRPCATPWPRCPPTPRLARSPTWRPPWASTTARLAPLSGPATPLS